MGPVRLPAGSRPVTRRQTRPFQCTRITGPRELPDAAYTVPHTLVGDSASICSGRMVRLAGSRPAGSGSTRHALPLKCSATQPRWLWPVSFGHGSTSDLEEALAR